MYVLSITLAFGWNQMALRAFEAKKVSNEQAANEAQIVRFETQKTNNPAATAPTPTVSGLTPPVKTYCPAAAANVQD